MYTDCRRDFHKACVYAGDNICEKRGRAKIFYVPHRFDELSSSVPVQCMHCLQAVCWIPVAVYLNRTFLSFFHCAAKNTLLTSRSSLAVVACSAWE